LREVAKPQVLTEGVCLRQLIVKFGGADTIMQSEIAIYGVANS